MEFFYITYIYMMQELTFMPIDINEFTKKISPFVIFMWLYGIKWRCDFME